MSAMFDWSVVTGGAGAVRPTGTVSGTTAAQRAVAAQRAAQAAAAAAQAAAAATAAIGGNVAATVISAARQAAVESWKDVTGGVEGYPEIESSILSQAAYIAASSIPGGVSVGTGVWSDVPDILTRAAGTVGTLGIGAALGSGTVLLIGAGLLLLVLLKR